MRLRKLSMCSPFFSKAEMARSQRQPFGACAPLYFMTTPSCGSTWSARTRLFVSEHSRMRSAKVSTWPLAFQTVVITFARYLVWFWLVRHYPATRISAFTLLTPKLTSAQTVMLRMKPSGSSANKVGRCSCFNHTARHKKVKAAKS